MKTKKIKVIRCKDVAKHVCENLDEKINSPLCREIKKHLQECPDCSGDLIALKHTVKLYRRYPTPKLPTVCHKNLMAIVSALNTK
jgi:hypothetical protein